jgi:hypothetical protein
MTEDRKLRIYIGYRKKGRRRNKETGETGRD